LEVLQTLGSAGWRIFYLSNTVGYSGPAIEPAYYSYAEAVFHSWQIGRCTPERAAFDTVATAAGLPPQAMLHVGDSWNSDIAGALAAGWQAVYLDRLNSEGCRSPRPSVPRIPDLRRLLTLLPGRPAVGQIHSVDGSLS
jgi:FMN phosphatase YigB (HAD superfamily)